MSSTHAALRSLVSCLVESLSSDDLGRRKAVAEALTVLVVLVNRRLWYCPPQDVKVDHAGDDGQR